MCVCKNPPCRGRVFYRLNPTVTDHPAMCGNDAEFPVRIPITGELDLHTFRPDEASDLLEHYLAECRQRGLLRVRVIHGKGTGTLRTLVHARLRRLPWVASFGSGDENSGGWGATIVTLTAGNSPGAPETFPR